MVVHSTCSRRFPTKIPVSLSISRGSNGVIRITVKDRLSRKRFVEVEMTPEEFGLAVTGLSELPVTASVQGLDVVGKRKITEKRVTDCPLDYMRGTEEMRQWLLANRQEEGWMINTYLGSQGDVKSTPGGSQLRYTVFKYIDVSESEEVSSED